VFGANQHAYSGHLEPSYLAESSLQLGGIHNLFARAEYVRKDAEELALGPTVPEGEFNVMALTGGTSWRWEARAPSGQASGPVARSTCCPASLSPIYGSATPTGFAVYVRLAPQNRVGSPRQGAARGPLTRSGGVSFR